MSRLELARSGSVEAYRQQAAIRRQSNPLLEVNRKNLAANERAADGIENLGRNPIVLGAANIA